MVSVGDGVRRQSLTLAVTALVAVGLTFLAFYCRAHFGPSTSFDVSGAKRTTLTGVVEVLWLASLVAVFVQLVRRQR